MSPRASRASLCHVHKQIVVSGPTHCNTGICAQIRTGMAIFAEGTQYLGQSPPKPRQAKRPSVEAMSCRLSTSWWRQFARAMTSPTMACSFKLSRRFLPPSQPSIVRSPGPAARTLALKCVLSDHGTYDSPFLKILQATSTRRLSCALFVLATTSISSAIAL